MFFFMNQFFESLEFCALGRPGLSIMNSEPVDRQWPCIMDSESADRQGQSLGPSWNLVFCLWWSTLCEDIFHFLAKHIQRLAHHGDRFCTILWKSEDCFVLVVTWWTSYFSDNILYVLAKQLKMISIGREHFDMN